jgi:hypothetical protein
MVRAQSRPVPDVRSLPAHLDQGLVFEDATTGAQSGPAFLARNNQHVLTLTRNAMLLHRTAASSTSAENASELLVRFSGAETGTAMEGVGELPGKVYHANANLIGPLQGRPTFRRVKYTGIYPGVDAIYYGNDRQLEFDFVVAPHANPNRIRLAFRGADKMRLTETGEMIFRLGSEEIRLRKPTIYQEHDGLRRQIAGNYAWRGKQQLGFAIGAYDKNLPLIIDPTITFAAYLGGSGDDTPVQVRANGNGEIYVAANSNSVSTVPGITQTYSVEQPQAGVPECFLTKISPDGSVVYYTVVFAGVQCLAMDVETGNVHLSMRNTGYYLRTLFEDGQGQPQILDRLQGLYDFSLGPAQWLRIDDNRNIYVIVSYLPTGATDPIYELQKIDGNGEPLGTMTLFTAAANERPTSLDVDDSGNAYITGVDSLGAITPTPNAFQATKPRTGAGDGFLLRVTTSDIAGVPFQIGYASYLGPSQSDAVANAIGFDRVSSTVFLAGSGNPNTFPFQSGQAGSCNPSVFILKLDLSQSPANQLVNGVLDAGSSANALTIFPGGVPVITGTADDSGNCNTPTRLYLRTYSPDLSSVTFSTYLDNTPSTMSGPTLATNGSQSLFVAVATNDETLGTVGAVNQTGLGGSDVLLRELDGSALIPAGQSLFPSVSFVPPVVNVMMTSQNPVHFPLDCGGSLYACNISDPQGAALTDFAWHGINNNFRVISSNVPPSGNATLFAGTYYFTLTVRDANGAVGSGTLTVQVSNQNTPVTAPGTPETITLTDELFLRDGERFKGNVHPAAITFDSVTSPGLSWLQSRSDLNPMPPAGMQAGSPPYYYDVHTTAAFTATPTLCLDTTGMSFADPGLLQVYELQSGAWTKLVANTNGNNLCVSTTLPNSNGGDKMTTVAVFYPQVPSTVITDFAGTGYGEGSIDGAGGDPRDDAANGVPALSSSITRPAYLAFDAARRYLYISESGLTGAIRKVDLNTNVISLIVPAGQALGSGPIALDPSRAFLYYVTPPDGSGGQTIMQLNLSSNATMAVAGGAACCSLPVVGQVATQGALTNIAALAVDSVGNVFVTQGTGVYRVNTDGTWRWILDESGNNIANVLGVPFADTPTALAFDSLGYLLVGGQTLVRLSRGQDGTVNGSSSTSATVIGGIPAANMASYTQPFEGDDLPLTQAAISIYQMIVAQDGSVIFADDVTHRIRRISTGGDGLVDGSLDANTSVSNEIVQTIAGFYDGVVQTNSPGFATEYYGDFHGLAQDPVSGNILASTYGANLVESFGISSLLALSGGGNLTADLSVTATATPDPVSVGGTLTYAINVSNNGPAVATSTNLSFGLPSNANFQSATTAQGTCTTPGVGSSGTVNCSFGSIGANSSVAVTVAVAPQLAGTLPASITVAGHELDNNSSNNVANVSTTVTTSNSVVVVNVTESVHVADSPASVPSDMSSITESIKVTDAVSIVLTPVITWPTPSPISYGTPLSATQLDATADVPGAFTYSPVLGTQLPLGTQTLKVTFTPNDTTLYTTATAQVSLLVNQTRPVVTWPTPSPITYGTALSASQLDASTTVAGTFAYSPALNSVLSAGSQTLAVTFTPTDTVDYGAATAQVTLVVNKGATSTSVISSPNPSTSGQGVTLNATITPPGAGAATGSVIFTDSVTGALGTALIGAGNVATLTTTALTANGSHVITATYSGDTNVLGSSAQVTQTVNGSLATTTTLASSVNPAYISQPVTFTATVTASNGSLAIGTVNFFQGTTLVSSATLVSGIATYRTTFATAGNRNMSARFLANAPYLASNSSALTQRVLNLPAATTTQVSSSMSPSMVGQAVIFTAEVKSTFGAIPDGETIRFTDGGGALLGTAPTLGGSASLSYSTLTAGSHQIRATYGGDPTFATSTSAAITQVVSKYATTTSMVSGINPSIYGQSVTLTATVVSQGPNIPTGNVVFRNGSTTLASVALNSTGVATLARSNLPSGTLSLTATYNGDTQSGTSVASFTQVVNPVTSSTSLTSSKNPSTFGQSVTLTATVVTASGVTATGTVTFMLGQTTLGTVTLSGGKARLTLTTLPRGPDQITATYGGTPTSGTQNIVGSTGSVAQQVN